MRRVHVTNDLYLFEFNGGDCGGERRCVNALCSRQAGDMRAMYHFDLRSCFWSRGAEVLSKVLAHIRCHLAFQICRCLDSFAIIEPINLRLMSGFRLAEA